MAESLVRLSHTMGVFFSLHGPAGVVAGVEELVRQLLGHAPTATLPREPYQPPTGERQPAVRPDLDRHLVGGAADAPGLDLQQRRGVAQRPLEDLDRLLLALPARTAQGVVDDSFGHRPLAIPHD